MRTQVAALSLSAAALVGIAVHEAYRGEAYLPTPNDVPTIGFGETKGVKLGDRTSVEKALVQLLARTGEFEQGLRRCLGDDTLMTQYEWDAVVGWAYNVGLGNACSSTLVRKARLGLPFCSELLRWDRQKGQVLPGLTKRRQQEYQQCLGN